MTQTELRFVCPRCGSHTPGSCAECPPCLEVQEGSSVDFFVLSEAPFVLGRGDDCQLRLRAGWVALRHARIEALGGAHQITALGAVLAGGQPVASRVLHDGDVLRLVDSSSGSFVGLRYLNPRAPKISAVQHFATPPGKPLLTIGRVDADILLAQPLVSKRHAELMWQDNTHVLRDCGSRTGTYVNGERLQSEQVLRPGDVVQIGTFRLTYDGDSLDSFDQHSIIRLDGRGLRRVVGDRVILQETTVSIEPCEFIGIVGASGSGKSTLMTALCGFQPADAGQVSINGDELYRNFDAYRTIIGYVPQDDILHRALSVEEALRYTARLRLPPDTTPKEVEARIARVLASVEMSAHREKRIEQLSGGQRKRVSIAAEMLADPSLLFLDEPTSGLDPGLERKMMYTLRTLADEGRTVVLVTHATANIKQCDHIIFVSAGRVIWFGPPFQALEFFEVEDFADIYTKTEGQAEPWAERFRGSLQHQKYIVERLGRAPEKPSAAQRAEQAQRANDFAHSLWQQLSVLTQRYLRLLLNDRRNLWLLLLQAPVIGLLLLLVSRPGSLTSEGRIEAKKMLFMLATTGVWFGVINSAREICKEAAIYRREKLAGLFTWPYLASKVLVLFALVLVQNALLFGVLALKINFPEGGVLLPGWLSLYVTAALSGLAGISLGLCISVVAMTPDKATSLIPIILVPQLLFAGMIFKLRGATEVLSWLTTSRWAIDAMGVATKLNTLRDLLPLGPEPRYDVNLPNLLAPWGALLAQSLLCLLIAWLALRRR